MDPHLPEYLAAMEGMHEHTPAPRRTYAVGDFVNGTTAGKRWAGRIMEIDDTRAAIDCDGAWIVVPPSDIDF